MQRTDRPGTDAPSTAVVEAVAAADGVEPTELSEPLFTAINPDTLDTLFRGAKGHITFPYHGYEVTVHATGEVTLEARE